MDKLIKRIEKYIQTPIMWMISLWLCYQIVKVIAMQVGYLKYRSYIYHVNKNKSYDKHLQLPQHTTIQR